MLLSRKLRDQDLDSVNKISETFQNEASISEDEEDESEENRKQDLGKN